MFEKYEPKNQAAFKKGDERPLFTVTKHGGGYLNHAARVLYGIESTSRVDVYFDPSTGRFAFMFHPGGAQAVSVAEKRSGARARTGASISVSGVVRKYSIPLESRYLLERQDELIVGTLIRD